MVNMAVPYRRSNYSLQTLQSEIRRTFPGREQNKGFVTGYKSPTNYTGHNADARGVTHAYDIGVDIEGDGSGLLPRDAEWLANYLRLQMNPRFAYLIYNRRIASNASGFEWVPYTGSSPHTDHIHISTVDLYWGDPCGVPASVCDSRASWGIYNAYHNVKPAESNVEPIKREWYEMALDREAEKDIERILRAVVRDEVSGDRYGVPRNQGTKESRAKNPTWRLEPAVRNIWAAANSAAHDAQASRAIVEKIAERSGLTKQEIKDAVTEALKESTVDVDIEVKGNQ